MRLRLRKASLLLMSVLLECRPASAPSPLDQEGAILRAALAYWATCSKPDDPFHYPVAMPDTVTGQCSYTPRSQMYLHSTAGGIAYNYSPDNVATPAVPVALWSAFVAANLQSILLDHLPELDRTRLLLTADSLPAAGRPLLWLTRAGVSVDGKMALVGISEVCGRLCGTGRGLLLMHTSHGWRVVSIVWSSIS
jgi:hypothetical protein